MIQTLCDYLKCVFKTGVISRAAPPESTSPLSFFPSVRLENDTTFFPLLPPSFTCVTPVAQAANRQFSPVYLSSSSLCQQQRKQVICHIRLQTDGGNMCIAVTSDCITKPAEADVILLCCGTLTNRMVNDYDTCIVHGHCSRSPNVCVCVCVCVCKCKCKCVWGSTQCNRVHSLGSKATETFKNMVVHFQQVDC